ncbi:hypothetical protein AKJ61_02325 [candidate division MSBL1 archaeon SCGC-AAA259B11]|uniref:CARDB domain-containing protein n=1 Tax=candidate division MSBL1 archaeon SCGC-AAA259B11 TaxID=1698260 RepID=A0A133U667_9EURY|nr:hypothetical protein AKJ61_02325 [candidate division MSBL1 archaeon SCGC-AAA259B11]
MNELLYNLSEGGRMNGSLAVKTRDLSKQGISTIIFLVGVIVITAVFIGTIAYTYVRPQPEFQVEGLFLSADKIVKGDTITAHVEVTNIGDARGTHTVKLKVGEETLKEKVILDAGESRTVVFDIEKKEKGRYYLKIQDLSESFVVVEPAAKFEVRDLTVRPLGCAPGENIIVSVNVQNTGEVKGTHTLKLRVDGTVEKAKNVELGSGRTSNISFTLSRKTTGTYSVKVGRMEKAFGVLKPLEPAEFEAKAIEFVKLLGAQKFDKAKKMLIDSQLADKFMFSIKEGWENIVVDYGNMQEIENVRVESGARYWGPEIVNGIKVHVLTWFENACLDIEVNFVDGDGISGVFSEGTPLHAAILR